MRVACVGDSITFGAGIEDREKKCYPAQLQELLGPRFEVRNFGRSGATASRKRHDHLDRSVRKCRAGLRANSG